MDHDISIDVLVDEFTRELRAENRPDIEKYVAEYPQLEEQIRHLFPMLEMMESRNKNELTEHSVDMIDEELQNLGPQPARRSIGDYRIIRELGRGGMGIVYLAEQEALGRKVAIKVLPESAQFDQRRMQRFQLEAKAAGKLHHSNIVPVFDVGNDDEVSFLVMQYIEGVSLDHVLRKMRDDSDPNHTLGFDGINTSIENDSHTSESELNSDLDHSVAVSVSALSVGGKFYRNVAKIGAEVSEALAYAHSEDVLHRDIKPGNLMLDSSGHAWITDFGLAKILNDVNLTKTGETVGTLRYVSPEQLNGRSDARSDIYSLGLTLYEMLTLKPAFKGSDFAEMVQEIGEKEPVKPRRIDSQIPRDLETIVLTAIEKDPRKRYQTADALRDDLQRYLDGKTIRAKQTSEVERFIKAVKRRPIISSLAALLLASLVLGASLTTWKWKEATNALAEARKESRSRLGMNNFLIEDLLNNANPNNQPDPNVQLITVLRRASENVDERFEDDPLTESEIRFQMGRVFYGLSKYDEALEHYQESHRIRSELLGDDDPETMQVLFRVGKAQKQLDNHEIAIPIFERVIDFHTNNPRPETENLLEAMMMKSGSLSNIHRNAEAEQIARDYVAIAKENTNLDLKNGLERLASTLYNQGKHLECESIIEERIALSDASSRTMSARNILALSLMARGETEKAKQMFQDLFLILEAEFGKEHDWTMTCAKEYANTLFKTGQFEESISILNEYLPISKRVRGLTSRKTISMKKLLAEIMLESGDPDSGIEILELNYSEMANRLGESSRDTIAETIKLAWEHRNLEDYEKAATLFEQAYESASKHYGENDRLALCALADLGDVHRKLKMYQRSEEYLTTAINRFRNSFRANHPDLLLSIRSLVKLYLKLDRFDDAEPLGRELVAGYKADQGNDSDDTIDAMHFLKSIYFEQKNYAKVKEVLAELYQIESDKNPFSEDSYDVLFELDYADGKLDNSQERIARFVDLGKRLETKDKNGNYWKARGLLGQAYVSIGDMKTAEQVLLDAHTGLESVRAKVDESFYTKYMGRTAGRLSELYENIGNDSKHDQWEAIYRSFRN